MKEEEIQTMPKDRLRRHKEARSALGFEDRHSFHLSEMETGNVHQPGLPSITAMWLPKGCVQIRTY